MTSSSTLTYECRNKILDQALSILSENLQTENILRHLKAKNALTKNDVARIRDSSTEGDKVEELLDRLQRRPVSAYEEFMKSLKKEERDDLYKEIVEIEKKCGYFREQGKHDEYAAIGESWEPRPLTVEDLLEEIKKIWLPRINHGVCNTFTSESVNILWGISIIITKNHTRFGKNKEKKKIHPHPMSIYLQINTTHSPLPHTTTPPYSNTHTLLSHTLHYYWQYACPQYWVVL